MGSKNKQLSRQERKAKIRAAEDRIPDIPELEKNLIEAEGEGESSKPRNDRYSSDKTTESVKLKRKREHEVEQGKGLKQDIAREEDTTTKKRKRPSNEKNIIKEKKARKINERISDEEQREKQSASLTSKSTEDSEETEVQTEKDLGRRKSKKERKAELKAARRELDVGKVSNGDADEATQANNIKDEKKARENGRNRDNNTLAKQDDDDTNPELGIDNDDIDTSKMHLTKSSKTTSASEISSNPSLSSSSMPTTNKTSSARFIVFVGNLPYTATTTSIMSHFSKLQPLAVRHLTKKENPNQSRGMAFVEFKNYDTHKTALKTMHHSTFNDGLSEARKINVELTAGGGGNKQDRKAKIKHKNDRLNEQRTRRIQLEEKAKLDKTSASEMPPSSYDSGIHPSRRRMITV